MGGLADHNLRRGKITMIHQLPPASEGGDRVMVGISKIVAESVNGCASTMPVYVPSVRGRAANVAQIN